MLQIKDLRSGNLLPDKIEKVGNVVWAADNKTLFYGTEDAAKRVIQRVGLPDLGTDRDVGVKVGNQGRRGVQRVVDGRNQLADRATATRKTPAT